MCVCVCACAQGCELKSAQMPAGWRCGGGVHKLQYSHRLCGDSVVTVVAVSLGSALIINGRCEARLAVRLRHQPMTAFSVGRAPGGEPIGRLGLQTLPGAQQLRDGGVARYGCDWSGC